MRALVTGSNGGIGTALVQRLRDDGFDVVTLDVAPPADLVLDLERDDVPALDDADVCVSNAGLTTILSPAHRMSREKWERDLAVNLSGSFRVVQACLGGMRARGFGRVVVMSSVSGAFGAPGQVAYAASKAGLVGMVRTIAAENVRRGITANAVLPGMIGTPAALGMPAEVVDRIGGRLMPMGRMGHPEEVAALVAFLVSPAAAYITGQAIGIDGGAALNTVSLGRPGADG
ncbi:SDR family oxidoreductase [Capillimicrobium parvum]|uniref:3-oxoacyl-[acyl-carrier-protein] reductase FabG1 n=1 Tax=Capillimicrobium parvum TaxID=2884022 RepID=A0A9E6XZJ3_9ACTN|nr:SDR family NAD(P)-dependent oxidoreductase [Capillimicrobium parvum]UGS36923.1 3-oxoacyl-[acyl-carrier-protein] reductase FabG1 [Capillimicrobium parvum]